MTARIPGKPDEDRLIAEREAALYDPDSRFRDHAAEVAAARAHDPAPLIDATPSGAPSLYAKGERKRAGAGLTKEMIKRIADRTEEAAARRKGE